MKKDPAAGQSVRYDPWSSLLGLGCFLILTWWGVKIGQVAPRLSGPSNFIGFFADFFPLIFFFLILARPRIGLMVLVFAISMSPRMRMGRLMPERNLELRLEDYLIPFLYFVWLSRSWLKGKMEFRRNPIYLPMTLYALVLTFSTSVAVLVGWAELTPAFYFWLKQIEYFAMFVLVFNLAADDEQRVILIWCFILTSILVSAWAIFQGVVGFFVNPAFVGLSDRVGMPFDYSPATLGEYYIMIIPLLILWLLPKEKIRTLRQALWRGLIVIMAAMGLLFSFSRGSVTGLLISLPIFLLLFFPRTRIPIIYLALFALVVMLTQTHLEDYSKFLALVNPLINFAAIAAFILIFIVAGIFIVRQRPLLTVIGLSLAVLIFSPRSLIRVGSIAGELSTTGKGLTSYQETYRVAQEGLVEEKYHSWNMRVEEIWPEVLDKFSQSPLFGTGVTSFHVADNQFLRTLGETGLAGFLCFFWMIWLILKNCWQAIRAKSWSTRKALGYSLLIGTIGLLIASISDDAFTPVKVMMNFWFLAGLFYSTWPVGQTVKS